MTHANRRGVRRRALLAGAAATALAAPAIAQGAPRVPRVWGEPGPYGGVFVQGMNE